MKQLLTLTLILLSIGFAKAQGNMGLTLFSENGELFTLYVNGEKINDQAQANVKMMDVSAEAVQARVDFEDGSLTDFSGNVMLHPGFMVNYMIKINRKGRYVIRFQSEAPYKGVEPVTEEIVHVPPPSVEKADVENTTTTTGQMTTTTTSSSTTVKEGNGSKDKVEMKMTVPGMDVEISMEGGVDMDGNSTETTTTYTETVTTTSGNRTVGDTRLTRPTTDIIDDGCAYPVDATSFTQMKKSISSKDFEDSKFTLAKQIVTNNCLSAAQVKEVMMLFDFEDTKLEFAKLAYEHTVDQNNYYMVNEAFD
ncbi:MAG: DUF4476 domain-containing protein, partial [Bacteroidota bacterium]